MINSQNLHFITNYVGQTKSKFFPTKARKSHKKGFKGYWNFMEWSKELNFEQVKRADL